MRIPRLLFPVLFIAMLSISARKKVGVPELTVATGADGAQGLPSQQELMEQLM